MTATILLADDDEMIVEVLQRQLEREGFAVLPASDGEAALALARTHQPDLVLLDVMMPKLQGWEVCRELRRESAVPILMLTARGDELDRVLGLELGADDYIVKPFSFRELLARIRANLRRVQLSPPAAGAPDGLVQLGALQIDRRRHTVERHGEPVNLAQKEYDLLHCAAGGQRRGRRPQHAAGHGLGRGVVWRHAHAGCPHSLAARETGGRPQPTPPDPHGPRRGLPAGDAGRSTAPGCSMSTRHPSTRRRHRCRAAAAGPGSAVFRRASSLPTAPFLPRSWCSLRCGWDG